MDERKVSQYPLVDFASPSGEAEMERYPTAGGANPVNLSYHIFNSAGQVVHFVEYGPQIDDLSIGSNMVLPCP